MTSPLTRRLFSPSQIYTRYGKCYTFNSGLDGNPLLTTLKGGTGNGLEIMLDIQQDEYLPVWGETGQCVSAVLRLLLSSPAPLYCLLPTERPQTQRDISVCAGV